MKNILSLNDIVTHDESLFFCILERIGGKKYPLKTVKVLLRVKDGEPLQAHIDVKLISSVKVNNTLMVEVKNIYGSIYVTRFWIIEEDALQYKNEVNKLLKRVD